MVLQEHSVFLVGTHCKNMKRSSADLKHSLNDKQPHLMQHRSRIMLSKKNLMDRCENSSHSKRSNKHCVKLNGINDGTNGKRSLLISLRRLQKQKMHKVHTLRFSG